jgi:hypothetical protein
VGCALGDVTECGLKGYENRHDARQAAKHHHHNHVRAFKCKRCSYWHLGELPVEVLRGEATAEEFYEEARNRVPSAAEVKNKQRSPAAQLRRWRMNTASGVARDTKRLADMIADEEVKDRTCPGWREAWLEAEQVLTVLPRLLRRLAEEGDG